MRAASETGLIVRHAGTVLVGQVAVMAFGVTDTIVAGRYSQDALAALSVGTAIYISVYVSLMGVLQALLPIWAELHGAGRGANVGRSVRQSLYLCGAAIVLGMAVLSFPGPLMVWTDVPQAMRADVERYLLILSVALPPSLLFRVFGTLNQSLGKPKVVTLLQMFSLAIKVPLSIWFAFGGAGLPAMGLVGCGWATLVVNYTMLGCALWLLRTQPIYREARIWQRMERPDWQQLAQFARLGVPGGLSVLVEITSFTLMALFIARLGVVASAAHQIGANLAALAYMMPMSIAIAGSARVSFWLGGGNTGAARAACRRALLLTSGFALFYAAMLLLWRYRLPAIYTDDAAVVAVAAQLLAVIALYHLADALQTVCVFILRCYRVTVLPLAIYCTLQWGVGLGGSVLLAYHGFGPWPAMQSPLAFWIMGGVALAITAALFLVLLRRTVGGASRAGATLPA